MNTKTETKTKTDTQENWTIREYIKLFGIIEYIKLSGKSLIKLLLKVILIITILIAFIFMIYTEVNGYFKEWTVEQYVKTVFIDKRENSNDYINSRIIHLEDQFGTKSNFLKEVEDYKIKTSAAAEEAKLKKESFLDN